MLLWITPSLAIGTDWVEDALWQDADEATAYIRAGNTAFVDTEATACHVLANLGLTPAEIADRIGFAKTGQVLTSEG